MPAACRMKANEGKKIMTDFFVDIQGLAEARSISPDHYEKLLAAVRPYCPNAANANVLMSGRPPQGGGVFNCVILTQAQLFFGRICDGLSYRVSSFKLFDAAAFVGQGFVLEAEGPPQFRLMLANGDKMRFALDTADAGAAKASTLLVDKLARNGIFRA